MQATSNYHFDTRCNYNYAECYVRGPGETGGPDSYRDGFALIFLLLFASRQKVEKVLPIAIGIFGSFYISEGPKDSPMESFGPLESPLDKAKRTERLFK